MNPDLSALLVARKTGSEPFHESGQPLPISLIDFWQWYCSDLTSNATRGVIAEFLVASDLGVANGVRAEWDAHDLSVNGIKVEVKSAAYLQSWKQNKLSTISFGVRPTISWNAQTNEYGTVAQRQADVYVFALLKHQNKQTLDPLDVAQWEFYILPTYILDDHLPTQANLSLATLLRFRPERAQFGEILDTMRRLFPGELLK
jgi:hypothetical protein